MQGINLFRTLSLLLSISISYTIASITITENTAQRLSFVFTMEDYKVSTYKAGDSLYSQVGFFEANGAPLDENRLALPCVSIHVGVPQSQNPSVSFISHEVKRIVLEHPLALEKPGNRSTQPSVVPFNNSWISQMAFIHFRDLRTGNFFIRPFLYDPQTQTLTILLKGSCTITFPEASADQNTLLRSVRGDYWAMVKDLVLNFDVARQWAQKRMPVNRAVQTRLFANRLLLTFKIGDGHNDLNETTTKENGIARITAQQIYQCIGSRRVLISSLALFGSQRKELDSIVPRADSIPSGVEAIPLLKFDVNKNGLFDGKDYALAYVTGLNDWVYDTKLRTYAYTFNHYGDYRTYWLSIDTAGVAVQPFACKETPKDTLKFFENRIRFKQSNKLTYDPSDPKETKGSKVWIWDKLNAGNPQFNFMFFVTDIKKDLSGFVRIGHGYFSGSSPAVFFGGSVLNDTTDWHRISDWIKPELRLELNGSSDVFEVEYLDFRYMSRLSMNGRNRLRIFSPVFTDFSSRIISYKLDSIPSKRTYIFRLSADESEVRLVDTVVNGGTCQWTDTAGIGIQYFVSTDSGLITIPAMDLYVPEDTRDYVLRDLRKNNTGVDYLIVTHKDFMIDAIELAAHKKLSGKFSNPLVVAIEDIFREFAGGNRDPGAVRNYIENLCYSSAAAQTLSPDYLLLLGTGHYDYKSYTSNYVNFIPPYEMDLECVEDFFGIVRPGENPASDSVAPSLFVGRIACLTSAEAHAAIEKIREMETQDADYGPWRNRALLVSDDDIQSNATDGIAHFASNERIEHNLKKMRPFTEIHKVYEFEYELNELYQKPEASNALFNEVNNGVAIVNFFGHGSYNAWTDETILSKDKINNFHNAGRYSLFNSFSCSVGYFDQPGGTCLTGQLVTLPDAGAIAGIASGRTASAPQNEALAIAFFNEFFKPGTNRSVGQSYALTKAHSWTVNMKHYVFHGDPSIRFMNITDSAQITVLTNEGVPHDTLKALQNITIQGKLLRNGIQNTAFTTTGSDTAYIQIGLYNPDQDSVRRKDGVTFTNNNPLYSLPGTPVFLGVTPVYNGAFSQKAFVPRKVTFRKPGAKVVVYAWQKDRLCATGVREQLVFSGSGMDTLSNKEGPVISVRPVYDTAQWNAPVSFTDKISSTLPFLMEIHAWDENGIDVTGIGPDEGLTVEIPDVMQRKTLNSKFTFDQGAFTKGKAPFELKRGDIKPGLYDLTIRAQDLLGNISKLVISLEILAEDEFKIGHVFNYPNPVHRGSKTKFFIYTSNTSIFWHENVSEVTIKIYTLSGKLIRVFRDIDRNAVEWDLTDQRGNPLPPNVYLYRVFMKKPPTGFSTKDDVEKSPVKKLVILPP